MAASADGKRIAWLPAHASHVFVTDDEGKHWQHGDELPRASHVLANRVSANVFYADNGLPVGEATGPLLDVPADITAADSLGFGRAAPGAEHATMYVAGKRGKVRGLFRSVDHGAHWQSINDDAHQFGAMGHVTGDPRVFGRVYFATGGRGIFYGEPKPAMDSSP